MRWTTLVLVIALALVCSVGYGQITLKEKNASLEKVLSDIEKQTKYVFLYDPDDLKVGLVTIEVKNASLQETLEKCFGGKPVEWTVVGNNVLLKKKRSIHGAKDMTTPVTIAGRAVDENGQPLQGVSVIIKREGTGTATDSSGAFSIPAMKGDILVCSFVGYKGREISIGDQRYLNIALEINPSNPDQVVVIGYGSSKKKDLTGSISVVDMKNIDEIPFNTVDNTLAGKAAGVQVTKTDGTPGGMVRMRIRGSSSLLGGNDPLYVIDGVPLQVRSSFINPGFYVSSPAANLAGNNGGYANRAALSVSYVNGLNSLGGLAPDDIESITVLKDASSTAIYGSKAANGVVIITTKTGKANMPPQVAVNYSSTLTSLYKPPKLLNAAQYKTLLTEAAQNAFDEDAAGGFPVDPLITAILDSPSTFFGRANTDWIKTVTRKTWSNHIGSSVSGGGQGLKYFSAISYDKTPGVVDGTDYQRISGKLNLESRISSKFSVATNLLAAFTNQDLSAGAYIQALLARPDWTPRDSTGNYTDFNKQGYLSGDGGFLNPVALKTAINNARTVNIIGSASGIYAISKGLHFRSTVSVNMQNYSQRNYLPRYIEMNGLFGNMPNPGGIGSNANSRFANWFLENTLDYAKRFNGKNALTVVIGQSYETTKYSWFRATATGYPNDNFLTGLSSAATPLSVAGDDPLSPQSYLLSFYARTNYSYLDKYLCTFTGRADGSSKFGPDNKFGYFPSGAVAWRISRENFLKELNWINDLKVRASYGLTGNQNIGDQMYRTLYTPVSYAGNSALIPTQLGNPGIKWESTKQTDIGLDMSFFDGRLNATVDYYNRQTSDGLLSLPIAASSTYSAVLQNAIGLRNRGLEISIGGDIVHTRNFKWTGSINATWNNSLVTRLDPQADLSQIVSLSGFETTGNLTQGYGNTVLAEGKPVGLIPGYFITGIIKTQAQLDAYTKQLGSLAAYYPPLQIGDPMYRLDTSTASYGYALPQANVLIANGSPKYFGALIQELSYKNIDLQCYFTFSMGGHLLWPGRHASTMFYRAANAQLSVLNRYTPANTNSNEPRLSLNEHFYVPSNLDVFSSSYVKLRSLTLNYHFGQAVWMKKAAIKNVQVFMSATNIFTITKYPGADPETSDDPYSVSGGYIDAGNYPATRTFSLGLKAVF
jgi:TonB-linked SusC/RagA family outer membrane protein